MSQAEPRELDEIKKEYSELVVRAGQAQYQREVMDAEVKNLNKRLYEVNIEAAKRAELDKSKEPANG